MGGGACTWDGQEEGGEEAVLEGAALPELQLHGLGPLEEAHAVCVLQRGKGGAKGTGARRRQVVDGVCGDGIDSRVERCCPPTNCSCMDAGHLKRRTLL